MNIAIERGLNAQPTKIGVGEKQQGYKVESKRLQSFVFGTCLSLFILAVLAIVYVFLYNQEVVKGIEQSFKLREQHGKDKAQSIRMAVALQQALAEHSESVNDANRMLKRIDNVIDKGFENLINQVTAENIPMNELVTLLADTKQKITEYINQEIEDFSSDAKSTSTVNKARLQKIAKIQEQSLRDLLKSVSGIKLDALEDMLEDLFDAVHKSVPLSIDLELVNEIDTIADKLYEETITKEQGEAEFNNLKKKIADLPDVFSSQIERARSADELADALDRISEAARLSSGRSELESIEKKWRDDLNRVGDKHKGIKGKGDDEEEEAQSTVDAMLQIQKLVSDGKVPVHLLDFEALDLDGKWPVSNLGITDLILCCAFVYSFFPYYHYIFFVLRLPTIDSIDDTYDEDDDDDNESSSGTDNNGGDEKSNPNEGSEAQARRADEGADDNKDDGDDDDSDDQDASGDGESDKRNVKPTVESN